MCNLDLFKTGKAANHHRERTVVCIINQCSSTNFHHSRSQSFIPACDSVTLQAADGTAGHPLHFPVPLPPHKLELHKIPRDSDLHCFDRTKHCYLDIFFILFYFLPQYTALCVVYCSIFDGFNSVDKEKSSC